MAAPHSPADYTVALLAHLPPGRVWPRDPDAMLPTVARGLAPTAARLDARAVALLVDAFPGTAFELLAEWERSLGLPDPCLGGQGTLQERRAQVVARLRATGGQSVPYLTNVAAALGFTITITEFAPSIAGRMRSGDRVAGARWAHAWRVTAPATQVVRFRSGASTAGEHLTTWGSAVLECELRRIAPAHAVLLFSYVGDPSGAPLGLFTFGRNSLS